MLVRTLPDGLRGPPPLSPLLVLFSLLHRRTPLGYLLPLGRPRVFLSVNLGDSLSRKSSFLFQVPKRAPSVGRKFEVRVSFTKGLVLLPLPCARPRCLLFTFYSARPFLFSPKKRRTSRHGEPLFHVFLPSCFPPSAGLRLSRASGRATRRF